MKKMHLMVLSIGMMLTLPFNLFGQTNVFPASGSVGIGTTAPASSSLLDMQSTTTGILIPRMTSAQRTAIVSPASGLLVYQTNYPEGFYYMAPLGWTSLSPQAINTDFLPSTSATFDLGSNIAEWDKLFLNDGIYYNTNQILAYNATSFGFGTQTYNALTGINNVAIGHLSASSITTGNNNVAVGASALTNATTGLKNSSIGALSMTSITNGVENSALGYKSLESGVNASYNTAVGSYALKNTTTGAFNTTVGYNSGYSNIGAYYNTYIGGYSGYSCTLGQNNCGVGYNSLRENTASSGNTAMGTSAGAGSNSFSNGTFVGYNAYTLISGVTNIAGFGYNARPTASNQIRIGNTSVTSIGGYAGWTNLSDGRFKTEVKEDVAGLDFILKLRPVTYHLNIEKIADYLGEDELMENSTADPSLLASRKDKQAIVYTGFIAQEVEKAAQELAFDFSGVDAPKNEQDMYGLRYAEFVVPIVKAIQEMAGTDEQLKSQIAALETANELLVAQNELLQQNINQINALLGITDKGFELQFEKLSSLEIAKLEQNIPNPFSSFTTVRCYIPASATKAEIRITSKTGVTISTISVEKSGWNEINIDTQNLPSGAYAYSLFVDGNFVESKQMVAMQ